MRSVSVTFFLVMLLSLVISLSGCFYFDSNLTSSAQVDGINVMMYKTQDENGNIGYRKIIDLCLKENTLKSLTGKEDNLTTNAEVNVYFEKIKRLLSYEYSATQELSGNTVLYIYEFTKFDKLEDGEDNIVTYEVTDKNIFREKYTFTFENMISDLPDLFGNGMPLGDIKSVFPNLEISSFPVNYYIYGGSDHLTNDGEGTRRLTTDGGESITFAYWETTIGSTPENFIYYRSLPVTLGWNILAIAAGVTVVAVLLTVMLVKNAKKKKDTDE